MLEQQDQSDYMHIQYKKNVHFTRLLKADGRLREFNFRRLNGPSGEYIFTIDVSDDRGNRILFKMEKNGNSWEIRERQLPNWVLENEVKFHEIIEEESKAAE